jgi:hypothetical protein
LVYAHCTRAFYTGAGCALQHQNCLAILHSLLCDTVTTTATHCNNRDGGGDVSNLGEAEKFMLEMTAVPARAQRLQAMVFKEQVCILLHALRNTQYFVYNIYCAINFDL